MNGCAKVAARTTTGGGAAVVVAKPPVVVVFTALAAVVFKAGAAVVRFDGLFVSVKKQIWNSMKKNGKIHHNSQGFLFQFALY